MSLKEKKELLALLRKLDELFDAHHAKQLTITQACAHLGMEKKAFVKLFLPLDQEKVVHLYGEPHNITEVGPYENMKVYIARLEDKMQELEFQDAQLSLNREQSHFNRIIALTGAILAAVTLMDFMAKRGLITSEGNWIVWAIGIGAFFVLLIVFSYIPAIIK